MSNENKFIDGLIVKEPHENAPTWVIAKLSIKREELIAWLSAQTGDWINADIKKSQGGKWYAAVDEWKPERARDAGGATAQRPRPPQTASQPADDFGDDDIPF